MKNSRRAGTTKFVALILGLAVLAILATLGIAYLVSGEPRGFMFWAFTWFLCGMEFLVAMLTVNIFARSACRYRPSGAAIAITYGIVAVYALLGLVSIIVYQLVRNEEGSWDAAFTGVLAGETVLLFVAAAFIYAHDLYTQGVAAPALEKEAEHDALAQLLRTCLRALREAAASTPEQRQALEIIVKKLEGVEAALSHSHGGGLGSWETPKGSNSQRDEGLRVDLERLSFAVSGLPSSEAEGFAVALDEISRVASKLAGVIDDLDLA